MQCVGSSRLLCLLFLRKKCLSARELRLKNYSVYTRVFRQHLEHCWLSILFLCPLSAFLLCVCWVFIGPSHLLYNSLGSWSVKQESLCYCLEQTFRTHTHVVGFPHPRQSSASQKVFTFHLAPKRENPGVGEHSLALGNQVILWTSKQEFHWEHRLWDLLGKTWPLRQWVYQGAADHRVETDSFWLKAWGLSRFPRWK